MPSTVEPRRCERCTKPTKVLAHVHVAGGYGKLCEPCFNLWFDTRDKAVLALWKDFMKGNDGDGTTKANRTHR